MAATAVPWVLKVGGRELLPGPELATVVTTVAAIARTGAGVVLVHGGGEEVSARCDELGLPVERVAGQRVTTDAVREVVAEVLSGRVNLRVVNALESAGVPALGLSGVSGGLLVVRPAGEPPGSLGWVGEPTSVNARLLQDLLEAGFTPVVAPLGTDAEGGVYNVNADRAASAIAGALGARLVLLTDVAAVRGEAGEPLHDLTPSAIRRLIARGTARDGMVPKLESAASAIARGAADVWVGDLEGFEATGPIPGHGTVVRADPRTLPSRATPVLQEQMVHARS